MYALAACVGLGIPFVYESHWKPKHAIEERLEGWFFERPGFQRLVVISTALERIYRALYPRLDPHKIVVARDAADAVSPAAPGAAHGERSRLSVAYVGSFIRGNGVDVVVELARRRPELDFHVVGGKEPELGDFRRATRGFENLTFHGFVAPARLGQVYPDFDVVLAPYHADIPSARWISPMKLFEYMAHGKAIVASALPVVREVLDDEQNALLAAPGDVAAFSRCLDRLGDAELRKRLGQAAQQKLEAEFTWRRRAERVLG
jgi:glycosyltransferase involved in cell wall biosynthesis